MGGYTGIKKDVLLCACSKAEAHLIRTAVEEADDRAFLMFTETSEVFGEGFRAETAGNKYGVKPFWIS